MFGLEARAQAPSQVCDVDVDGDIDQLDIIAIFSARNTPANGPGDPRDAVPDGFITVNDGAVCTSRCTIAGCPIITPSTNEAPIADAGDDQTVTTGQMVTLDGSGSWDPDGDLLAYAWTFEALPAGSQAVLSDSMDVRPAFFADVAGQYIVRLVVNDGEVDSAPDEVVVITAPGNTPPIADAGADQTARVGDVVTLDGSRSSDVDAQLLEYGWTILDSPAGSAAVLSDERAVNPTFFVDLPGTYVIQLVVNDGLQDSAPDTVVVTTANSPPVADAGPDQTVALFSLVQLDGSASGDADGDLLTYAWSLTSTPPGSAAVLANAGTSSPTFVVDVAGTYVARLIVNDGQADSAPDSVVITTSNTRPVADAGPDRTADVGDTVQLDGSASFDADGDLLTYDWAFTSIPAGSSATIDDYRVVDPSFVPDVDGLFVVQLIVNDGQLNSEPSTTTITVEVVANTPPNAAADIAATDEDVLVDIDVLDNDSDDDGDPLEIAAVAQPSNGTAALAGTAIRYTPAPDFYGSDSFSYTVTDGTDTSSATVTVTVNPVNDAPTAANDAATTDQGVSVDIDVLANDTDIDGDTLTAAALGAPSNGTVTPDGAGGLRYTPNAGFSGVDSFTYGADDGQGGVGMATVTVTVNARPIVTVQAVDADAAEAGPDTGAFELSRTGATVQPLTVSFSIGGTATSGADYESIASGVTIPAGEVSAVLTVVPIDDALIEGAETVELTLEPGAGYVVGAASTAAVMIADRVNTPPVANAGADQSVVTGELATLDGSGSGDLEGSELGYAWSFTSVPDGSTAALAGANTAAPTFTPDVPGAYVVQLIVSDGFASSAPDTVTVTAAPRGPATITLTPENASAPTRDRLTLTATLDRPALAGGLELTVTADSDLLTPPAEASVPEGESTIELEISTNAEPGTATLVVSAAGLESGSSVIRVEARTFELSAPTLGVNRDAVIAIELDAPAPSGGAAFAVSVLDSALVSITQTEVQIPEGESSAEIAVAAGALGGITTLTVDGTADGYVSRSVELTVIDRLLALPEDQELALGESAELTLTLIAPEPAPAGGLAVSVASSDPAVVEVLTPNLVVPEGAFEAAVTIRASASATGVAQIVASAAGYASGTTDVAVSAALDIVETAESVEPGAVEPISLQLLSGGEPFAAPPGGVTVTLTSDDPACVAVPPLMTIAEGEMFGSADVSDGGGTAPCTATVTAVAPLFGADSVAVTIESVPDVGAITLVTGAEDSTLGAGLQTQGQIMLSTPDHGGVTLQVQSGNASLLRIAPTALSGGTPVLELPIPDGTASVPVFFQGVPGALGSTTVSVSSPTLTGATATLNIAQPVLVVDGLDTATLAAAPDDPFTVSAFVRTLGGDGRGGLQAQQVSADAGPLTVTLTSSDPAVGQLVGATTGATIEVELYPGPSGALAPVPMFRARSGGVTTVSASAPGFDPAFELSSVLVEVVDLQLGIAHVPVLIDWPSAPIPSGYWVPAFVGISDPDHGGLTITVSSSDPSVLRLATPSTTDPNGTESVELFLPDGETGIDIGELLFAGVPGAEGQATVTASASGLEPASITVAVQRPALSFTLDGSVGSVSVSSLEPALISAIFGVLQAPDGTVFPIAPPYSSASPGPAAGPITVTTSDPAVGLLAVGETIGESVQYDLSAGFFSDDPNSQLRFVPLSAGTTTITASSPLYDSIAGNSLAVTVTTEAWEMEMGISSPFGLGGGLQSLGNISLGRDDHGGVSVTLTSSDPDLLRLAPDAATPGSGALTVFVPDGSSFASFYFQGVLGAAGTATVTATASQFIDASLDVDVVRPVLRLRDLPAATTTLAPDAPFSVATHVRHPTVPQITEFQPLAPGVQPLTVTLTSSDTAVGQLVGTTTGGTVQIELVNGPPLPGAEQTNVPEPRFDPLAGGTTTISASAPGFDSAPASVNVTEPTMTWSVNAANNRIGGGLWAPGFPVLSTREHQGVTVTVESSDPSRLLVSSDSAVVGSASTDVFIPPGSDSVFVYLQGVRGATGSVTLTASSPGISSVSTTVDVVQPVLQMAGLPFAISASAPDRLFSVSAGVASLSGSTSSGQGIAPGSLPWPITLSSSDPAVAQLVGTTRGGVVQIEFAIGDRGGISAVPAPLLDPLSPGDVVVTASGPDFDPSFVGSSVPVIVQ